MRLIYVFVHGYYVICNGSLNAYGLHSGNEEKGQIANDDKQCHAL